MSPSSPSLRTPTVAVSVRLALRGEVPVEASLFMPDVPRNARSQLLEDVQRLLEEDRDFLPVEVDGQRSLINRSAIDFVAVARRPGGFGEDDEVSDVHTLFDYRCPVRIELIDGLALGGTLLFSTPADRARLVDFLNLGPRFVQLWTSGELILVQRGCIRRIAETAEA
ncbi:MAG: hypothetical protein R3B48_19045 [Kofleriaceae bacterium]